MCFSQVDAGLAGVGSAGLRVSVFAVESLGSVLRATRERGEAFMAAWIVYWRAKHLLHSAFRPCRWMQNLAVRFTPTDGGCKAKSICNIDPDADAP